MTWSPPEPLPAPPTATLPPPSPDAEQADDDRARSGLPAATWIALLGGALVLVAACSIVVSNWDTIGRTLRVAGLLVGTGGLLICSERMRRLAPTTSNVVAHVGTFLTATVGIATMSLFGVTWPGCLVAGGLLALGATAAQAERWSPTLFRAGQVGAIALAATGLAALTGTTGGMIAALAALTLLAYGADRRAAGLAILAVFSPVLGALADAGIGAGTFERAGLVGEQLSWSGPVVGVLAAMVLGVAAQRRRANGLAVAAAAAPVVGLVTGLAAIDGSIVAWLAVPALIAVAGEVAIGLLASDRHRGLITTVVDLVAGVLAAIGLFAPLLASELALVTDVEYPWAVPCVATAFALVVVGTRWRRTSHRLADVGIASLLAVALATVLAFDPPTVAAAALAVAAVGAGAVMSRRLRPVAIYVPSFWAIDQIGRIARADLAIGSGRWLAACALAAGLFGVVVAARARLAADGGIRGWFEMSAVILSGGAVAAGLSPGHGSVALIVGGAAVAAAVALADRRWHILQIGTVGYLAVATTAATFDGTAVAPGVWIGWTVVTATFAAVWISTRSQLLAHAATSAGVLTVAAFVAGRPPAPADLILAAMGAVVVLTGLALTMQRRTPLDSAAITAGVLLACAGGLPVHPAWVSGIWVVLGLQILCYGVAIPERLLAIGGAAVTICGVMSWWFTTPAHVWLTDVLAPTELTVGDLWMLGATLLALTVGWAVRRVAGISSWLAYGSGLAIGGLWSIGAQLDRDPAWAIPVGLTLGVAAAGAGAWYRLAAPLVGGTVIATVTTLVATGTNLTELPTWTWMATAGLVLLSVAVLIERTSKQGTTLRDLVDRWD